MKEPFPLGIATFISYNMCPSSSYKIYNHSGESCFNISFRSEKNPVKLCCTFVILCIRPRTFSCICLPYIQIINAFLMYLYICICKSFINSIQSLIPQWLFTGTCIPCVICICILHNVQVCHCAIYICCIKVIYLFVITLSIYGTCGSDVLFVWALKGGTTASSFSFKQSHVRYNWGECHIPLQVAWFIWEGENGSCYLSL